MGFFKKALKSSWKINKGVFTGSYVKKGIKSATKYAKSNPELAGLAGSAFGIPPGLTTGFLGGGGGFSVLGGGEVPAAEPQPEQPDGGFAPGLPILPIALIGGAVILFFVLKRK